MKNEFIKFYKLAVEEFINENLDEQIYNNQSLIEKVSKYENGIFDDVVEFLDEQIYQLLKDEFNIEL